MVQKAVAQGDATLQEEKSWELFAWLRKREQLGIRQPPPELAVHASAIRSDPLDFGEKLAVRKPKTGAALVGDAECPKVDIVDGKTEAEQFVETVEGTEQDSGEPQSVCAPSEVSKDNLHNAGSNEGGPTGSHGTSESGLTMQNSVMPPEAQDYPAE